MPFWRTRIHSPLPADAVEERVRRLIQPKQKLGFWERMERAVDPKPDDPPFRGSIAGRAFRMVRIIRYRNTFLPVIRGTISAAADGGTTLHLHMHVHPLNGVPIAAFLVYLAANMWRSNATPFVVFTAFVLAIALGGFIPEARKAMRLLRAAVEG